MGYACQKKAEETILIDKENGDTLWWDAIMKDMKNVRPAFEVFEKLKDDKAEVPDVYLGATLSQVETETGTKC